MDNTLYFVCFIDDKYRVATRMTEILKQLVRRNQTKPYLYSNIIIWHGLNYLTQPFTSVIASLPTKSVLSLK